MLFFLFMPKEQKKTPTKSIFTPGAESFTRIEDAGHALPPPVFQLQKAPSIPKKKKEDKKLSFGGLMNMATAKGFGGAYGKKISSLVKLLDPDSSKLDKAKGGIGVAKNSVDIAKGAADKMGATNPASKLGKLGANLGIGGSIFNIVTGNGNLADLATDSLELSSGIATKMGHKALGSTLGKFAGGLGIAIEVYNLFDNYFGSFERARQMKYSRNYRKGFARGLAASLMGENPAKEKYKRIIDTSVATRVSRTIGSMEKGNNDGVNQGYEFAGQLSSAQRMELLEIMFKTSMKGEHAAYRLRSGGYNPSTFAPYLLPTVDALFEAFRKKKAAEKKAKEKAERMKYIKKADLANKNYGGWKM